MTTRYLKFIFWSILLIFVTIAESNAQINESHIRVAMRMIGHEVLLNSGDSASRVLAIERKAGKYEIPFEKDLEFDPAELIVIVDSIIQKAKITNNYIVEVENCQSKKMIYSYEMTNLTESNLIPCGGRVLPKGCYKILITFLENNQKYWNISTNGPIYESTEKSKRVNLLLVIFLVFSSIFLVGLLKYSRKKKTIAISEPPQVDDNIIYIGNYQLDKRNRILSINDESVELTHKEAALLMVLFNHKNTVLERGKILQLVWGDEGGYIGRTLDVFISKLRKKLAADSNLKIENVRGVGYKLIVN